MGIIVAIITLAIFLLLAIKKNYMQILVFLIIYLILAGIFVNAFATTPLIGNLAILVGSPILSTLIYVMIELICMSIFYYILKKYNYIVSLIVYLVIKLLINIFYMTISGEILLDLIFNFIIGYIIITVYKENIQMEVIKWFAIIGMIIDTVCTFLIASFWKIVGGMILLLFALFKPLIICTVPGLILFAIIIWLTRKKLSKKSEIFKIIIYVIILFFCECASMTAGGLFIAYESHKPDERYIEMNKINNNQSLIGLSKEQVVEQLGGLREVYKNKEDKEVYSYYAGEKEDKIFFTESYVYYKLVIVFDENDIVESTSIVESLRLGG